MSMGINYPKALTHHSDIFLVTSYASFHKATVQAIVQQRSYGEVVDCIPDICIDLL